MLLNRNNLGIHKFCNKEESRYTLQAILVTKEATVCTDGHRLVWVSTPKMSETLFPSVPEFQAEDIDKPLLLPADVAAQLAASIPKGKQELPALGMARIGQLDGVAKGVTTDLDLKHMVEGRKLEGQFPNFNAPGVIPTEKPAFEVFLGLTLLAEIAQYMAKVSPTIMRVRFYGSDKPVRFDAQDPIDGQGMTAVLMPMREGGSSFEHCYQKPATAKEIAKS